MDTYSSPYAPLRTYFSPYKTIPILFGLDPPLPPIVTAHIGCFENDMQLFDVLVLSEVADVRTGAPQTMLHEYCPLLL